MPTDIEITGGLIRRQAERVVRRATRSTDPWSERIASTLKALRRMKAVAESAGQPVETLADEIGALVLAERVWSESEKLVARTVEKIRCGSIAEIVMRLRRANYPESVIAAFETGDPERLEV